MRRQSQAPIDGEIWRSIPEWGGIYEASSLGRVRRVACGLSTWCGYILTAFQHPKGYFQVTLSRDGKCSTSRVARLVASAFLPDFSSDLQVDHISGDRTDDRPQNLRMATGPENAKNRCINKNSSTGFKGVTFRKKTGRYTARISVDGRRIELGEFSAAADAASAYSVAASELHGRFAREVSNATR